MTAQETEEIENGETAGGRDRRRCRRFVCDMFAEVVAAHEGTLFRGKILDISRTGCYIETRARLKLERLTDVEMLFRVNNHHFRTTARVMDIRPGKGLGVEFRPVDSQARELLEELLQELLQALSATALPE